jgi:MFS family permease
LTIGCILVGLLSDRLGAARILIGGVIALAMATYLFYSNLDGGTTYLLPLYGLVGLTVGIVSIVPHIMVKSFPPAIRFSGISFAYNVSYAIFGGLTPLIVTSLPSKDLLGAGYYVILLCLVGLVVGLFLQRSDLDRVQALQTE